MYYNVSERGWGYFIFSLVAFFVYNETMAYYLHRLFHNPWLYRNIHKMHHRYHQPTAWSAVAMHPAEFIMYQGYLAATPFLVPIHACKWKIPPEMFASVWIDVHHSSFVNFFNRMFKFEQIFLCHQDEISEIQLTNWHGIIVKWFKLAFL